MSIFNSTVRTDGSPLRNGETAFDFYNRAAGPEYDAARSRIENWISRVPEIHQEEIIARIKSDREDQVHSTFWHCFLNSAFLNQGFSVDFEPAFILPDGTKLNPDMVISKDRISYVVDAVVVFERNEYERRMRAQTRLVDELNERLSMRPDGKFLAISFETEGALQDIRVKRFSGKLDRWLNELPASANDAEFIHEEKDWRIELSYVADGRPGLGRIMGFVNRGVFLGDATRDSHDIRDALREKARKYRPLGMPVIPAIQIQRRFMGNADVRCGLYGNFGAEEAAYRNGFVDATVRGDFNGVWATKDGPDCKWSPCVIALESLRELPSSDRIDPYVWLHPWADMDVEELFDWDEIVLNDSNPIGVSYKVKDRS